MRVVLDTNIWISGLLWRGLPWQLLRLAEAGQVELCVNPSTLTELQEVLTNERLQARIRNLGLTTADMMLFALNVATLYDDFSGDTIVWADPDDDIFLHLAVAAQASYVVSGDNHLLEIEMHSGILILTIREFMAKEFPETVA